MHTYTKSNRSQSYSHRKTKEKSALLLSKYVLWWVQPGYTSCQAVNPSCFTWPAQRSEILRPPLPPRLLVIVTFLYLILQPLILTFTRTYDLHPALRHIHPIIYPLFSPKFKAKETSGQLVCWKWTWCWWAWCWWWRCEGERKEKPLPILLTSTSGNRSPWIWVTKVVWKFITHSVRFWNGVDPDNPQHSGIL